MKQADEGRLKDCSFSTAAWLRPGLWSSTSRLPMDLKGVSNRWKSCVGFHNPHFKWWHGDVLTIIWWSHEKADERSSIVCVSALPSAVIAAPASLGSVAPIYYIHQELSCLKTQIPPRSNMPNSTTTCLVPQFLTSHNPNWVCCPSNQNPSCASEAHSPRVSPSYNLHINTSFYRNTNHSQSCLADM